MTGVAQGSVFGKRNEPHTVIIARGDDIRHFTIRPWLATLAISTMVALATLYMLATSYLVLRDDLLGATMARQARAQQAYEDRISALRTQVDRITSRQLLDQQLVESKVTELLARQNQLTQRHGRLEPVLGRMSRSGGKTIAPDEATLPISGTAPVPQEKPELHAFAPPVHAGTNADADVPGSASLGAFWSVRQGDNHHETAADQADRLFVTINQSLRTIEEEQIEGLDTLAENAFQTADTIAEALAAAGLKVVIDSHEDAVGGPLLPVESGSQFEARVRELDEALDKLETVKAMARAMPVHNPAPGKPVSSSFGVRRDPILRLPAMHSGIDFRAGTGTDIRAAGAGTVTRAGWAGGYGRMVELNHGNGITTRYAHMSKINVRKGARVESGDIIGKVGSSGRSTGPHLHYEVRRNGAAIDPLRFLKAGKKIAGLL